MVTQNDRMDYNWQVKKLNLYGKKYENNEIALHKLSKPRVIGKCFAHNGITQGKKRILSMTN